MPELLLARGLPFPASGVAGSARVGGGFGAGAFISPFKDNASGSVTASPIIPGAIRDGGWLNTAGGYAMLLVLETVVVVVRCLGLGLDDSADDEVPGCVGAGLRGLTRSGISSMLSWGRGGRLGDRGGVVELVLSRPASLSWPKSMRPMPTDGKNGILEL